MQLLSTSDVATALNCTTRTVQRLASHHAIGSRVGRSYVFSAGDVARLKTLLKPGPGNPLMGAGQPPNYGKTKRDQR